MTDQEWMVCNDAAEMLNPILTGDRKRRLFACACCRQIWDLLADPRSRTAVNTAERFADGYATNIELAHARADAYEAYRAAPIQIFGGNSCAEYATWETTFGAVSAINVATFVTAAYAGTEITDTIPCPAKVSVRRQADLARDLFAPPSIRGEEIVRNEVWITPQVCKLAEAAYEYRNDDYTLDNDRLAVLADALEDAGCDQVNLLEHLRHPSDHFRGCWALDYVLGRTFN